MFKVIYGGNEFKVYAVDVIDRVTKFLIYDDHRLNSYYNTWKWITANECIPA